MTLYSIKRQSDGFSTHRTPLQMMRSFGKLNHDFGLFAPNAQAGSLFFYYCLYSCSVKEYICFSWFINISSILFRMDWRNPTWILYIKVISMLCPNGTHVGTFLTLFYFFNRVSLYFNTVLEFLCVLTDWLGKAVCFQCDFVDECGLSSVCSWSGLHSSRCPTLRPGNVPASFYW